MSSRSRWSQWGTAAWCAFILALTLRPEPSTLTTSGFCLLCGERGLADALLNVGLFLPLGIGGRMCGLRPLALLGLGLAFSGTIEGAQFFTPGRDASLGDILFNGMGVGIGALLSPVLPRVVLPDDAFARRASVAWSLTFGASLLGLAWLLVPQFSGTPLELHARPPAPAGGTFEGRIMVVRVGGQTLPREGSSRWPDPNGLRAGERLEVRFTAVKPRWAFRPLIGLFERGGGRWPMLLGPKDDGLILRFRRRADAFRFTRSDVRLDGAFDANDEGKSRLASVWRQGDAYCLQVDEQVDCGLGFTAGSGWGLLVPSGWANASRNRWLDAVWLALWAFPLGYWRRPGTATWLATFIALVALTAVPAATHLLAAPGWTLGGLATGWLAGALIARAAEHATNTSPGTSRPTADRG